MSTLPSLPSIEVDSYLLSPDVWEETVSEIHRVRQLIQDAKNGGRDLEPGDVKTVKALYKKVTDFGNAYSKALNSAAKAYKKLLSDMLEAENYSEIDTYIEAQKERQRLVISNRIAEKIDKLNEIVNNQLDKYPNIKSTGIPELIPNAFIKRFPKINSGDANKSIKNWEPIENIIEVHLDRIEKILVKYPVLRVLPMYSESMKAIVSYLNTSETLGIDNIEKIMEADRTLIETLVLKNKLKTESDVLKTIESVMGSDGSDQDKLSNIKKVIDVWLTR